MSMEDTRTQSFQELGQRHESMLAQVLTHIMQMQSVAPVRMNVPDEEIVGGPGQLRDEPEFSSLPHSRWCNRLGTNIGETSC